MDDVLSVYTIVGEQVAMSPEATGDDNSPDPSTIGQVLMELKPVESRSRHSDDLLTELRDSVQVIPGASRIVYETVSGQPNESDFEFRIHGHDVASMNHAVAFIKSKLAEYQGVEDISDNLSAGKLEAQVRLNALGRMSGVSVNDLALDIRAAVFGVEAQTLQRGREEVEVRVRLRRDARDSIGDLDQLRIATAEGGRVPFSELGTLKTGRSDSTIYRYERKRTARVSANLDDNVANTSSGQITEELIVAFADIGTMFPGVTIEFGGERERLAESNNTLLSSFLIACVFIYMILALVFRSYVQPVIIMFSVPFGLVGAVIGHLAMGYPMTPLSWIGLVALSGVVVNDSLILIDFINRMRQEGHNIVESIIEGGRVRIRPIMLTSVTTIFGLIPLLMSDAYNAQVIIPMAISLSFGLAFATVLTLLIVPCLYYILDDFFSLSRRGYYFVFGEN